MINTKLIRVNCKIGLRKVLSSVKAFLRHIYEDSYKGYLLSYLFFVMLFYILPSFISDLLNMFLVFINYVLYTYANTQDNIKHKMIPLSFKQQNFVTILYSLIYIMTVFFIFKYSSHAEIFEGQIHCKIYSIGTLINRGISILIGMPFRQYMKLNPLIDDKIACMKDHGSNTVTSYHSNNYKNNINYNQNHIAQNHSRYINIISRK